MYLTEQEKYLNINMENIRFFEPETISQNLDDIISVSQTMQKLKERILKVSKTKSTVMIYGETGTGKELVAKAIHKSGKQTGSF